MPTRFDELPPTGPIHPFTATFRYRLQRRIDRDRLVCVVIGVAGYLWARHLYNGDPSRRSGPTVAQLLSTH